MFPGVTAAATASSVLKDAWPAIHELTMSQYIPSISKQPDNIFVETLKMTRKALLRLIDGSVTISPPVSVRPLSWQTPILIGPLLTLQYH